VGDGLFTPISYPNIAITGPAGMSLAASAVTPFSITGTALIDVDAQGGPISVTSGPAGNTKSFSADDVEVAARTPMALTADTPATGMVMNPYDSQLYSYDVSAAGLASFSATSSNPNATPGVIVLSSSGHFADGLLSFADASTQFVTGAASFYLIYWDNTGASGYDFSVGATDQAFSANANDTEPNDAKAQAQDATMLPFGLLNGNLSIDDQDWIKVTATAADVGKTLHAITGGGDQYTDTLLDICDSTTCDADLSDALAESSDAGYNDEDLTFTIPAAGTYYVVVSASQAGYFDPSYTAYDAAVWIE
jgi:hypothetical protein